MAILLPQQFYNLPAGVGKSYYENLAGGTNASATVNNFGPFPVSLVITRVNAPVVTYIYSCKQQPYHFCRWSSGVCLVS